jgi:signal transduction histidine kinase
MRWLSGFRSGAFRFALLLALAFAASAALLLAVVERSISQYAAAATDGGLKSEAAILQGEDREGGRSNLLKAIDRHRRAGGEEAFRYQVMDGTGRVLVNDMSESAAKIGWGSVSVRDDPGDAGADPEILKSLGVPLADGGVLVVATDTYDIQELRKRLDRFTIMAGVGITVFALIGGYLIGGLFMRRLDRVNDAIGRVMAGNVTERLPTIGISREFDLLSSNLNAMLDRISALMDGLRQVTTDIAHDLRTPLSRLRQQLEASREARDAERYEASIASAIEQTDEILSIFRALLRIGTLEGGDGRQYFSTLDLSELVGRVIAAHEPVAEDEDKILVAEHEAGLLVDGDAELLAQMMTNLVDNAIRHTPARSRIVSKLERIDGNIVASISDDGPGIPTEERANVLTRFYRLDRSRNLPGAGLGMSLAAAIAALHHARLELLDNCPGLRVRLTFPKPSQASDLALGQSADETD